MNRIKIILILSLFSIAATQAQEEEKKALRKAERDYKESKNITSDANENLVQNDFVNAEADYRRAISKSAKNATASYNLGRAYYNRENFSEAFGKFKQAGEKASSKDEKHKAYHNMGNVFMQKKEYAKAVEAYKEALRANPKDEETRYNLALAKELLKKQQDEQKKDDKKDDQKKDDNKDDKEKNKDQDDKVENDKGDDGQQKDKHNKDNKGEDGDKGKEKPKDDKEGKGDKKEQEKQKPKQGDQSDEKKKPRPNQLSKQQAKNLLEAMQNEEKKVQQKIDAKKIRGPKVKNEKDW